jgi:hypothetical protein
VPTIDCDHNLARIAVESIARRKALDLDAAKFVRVAQS